MELFEAIKTRRSIRTYTQEKVSRAMLEKIIEAGTWAPTACNRQAFRFIAVEDQTLKKKIVDNGAAAFIANAPVVVFVLYDNRTDNTEYADHVQSASAVIENIILAAHALGAGSCWVCHIPRKEVLRKLLNIPNNFDPIACIPLGHCAHVPKPQPRPVVSDVLCFNSFTFGTGGPKATGVGARRRLRRIYFKMPPRMRKVARPLASRFEKKFEGT